MGNSFVGAYKRFALWASAGVTLATYLEQQRGYLISDHLQNAELHDLFMVQRNRPQKGENQSWYPNKDMKQATCQSVTVRDAAAPRTESMRHAHNQSPHQEQHGGKEAVTYVQSIKSEDAK